MTDDSRGPRRIDLRVLDEPDDPTRAERIIHAALAGVVIGEQIAVSAPGGGLGPLAPSLAAAVLAVAAGLLLFSPRPAAPDTAGNLIASWTESSHVPTNGELLAAFGGYQP